MSSFIAHSLVGFIISSQKSKTTIKESIVVAFFFIVLASAPDIDYLINYLRGEIMPIRYTHSMGFIFLVGLFSLAFRNILFRKVLHDIPITLFFLAPFSHLILDFFVGVHGNPYLYPISSEVFVSPLGVLPSSGRIDIHNHYFWRNILIELAIFVPFMFAFIPRLRAFILKHKLLMAILSLLFIVAVIVGVNLDRG